MNDLSLSILGFPAVNGDLQVDIRDSSGTVVRTARPFLDGTVRIPNMDPGAYELSIAHPNVVLPLIRQPIRILPVGDTSVSVLIDPSKFRNTPIADIPDANLGPVRDRTQSIGETMLPLTRKLPGEAITSADWNAMASAIRDLSQTTGELTRLVTPTGHDHPELTTKIEEMVTNFSDLLTTLGAAMTELQRQIQALRFRRQMFDVLDQVGVDDPTRLAFTNVIDQLDASVTDTPVRFGRTARTTGVQLGTQLDQLIAQQAGQGNDVFVNSDQVKNLQQSIDLLKGMRATTYSGELEQLRNVDRQLGTGGLSGIVTGRVG